MLKQLALAALAAGVATACSDNRDITVPSSPISASGKFNETLLRLLPVDFSG